jgi:hypothetical protein
MFRKPVQKNQVSLNQVSITCTLHEDMCTFMIISRSIRLETRNVSDKSVEKIKMHILCSIIFFFENRTVYEIMCKNGVEQDRPQTTIWRKRTACWVTRATNTHSEYVILIAFLLQQWLRERTSMIRYT